MYAGMPIIISISMQDMGMLAEHEDLVEARETNCNYLQDLGVRGLIFQKKHYTELRYASCIINCSILHTLAENLFFR